ncbi:MAG: peptidoglycan-binding domain-containing protein [Actinomycetia bacterium]|nr:peptidoglycan-binding domain-containing protein [Actinomycetes bacterium]
MRPRLIVLHTAEGARTVEALGAYFKKNVLASSHTGIDDTRDRIGEYVSRGHKAWTQANANAVSVSVELCGFAAWTRAQWMNEHRAMLETCARWIAEESAHFGIPIVKLSAAQAQATGRGVCQHRDLGKWGGGHTDCGNGFPMDEVLAWARGTAPAAAPSQPGTAAPKMRVSSFSRTVNPRHPDVRVWQDRMKKRGWRIAADQVFGNASHRICVAFQREKGLKADGIVGPRTWEATWRTPVT